jgi:hypothetical protein
MNIGGFWRRLTAWAACGTDPVVDRQLLELRAQLPIINIGVALSSLLVAVMFFDEAHLYVPALEAPFIAFIVQRTLAWRRLDVDVMTSDEKRGLLRRTTLLSGFLGAYCSVAALLLTIGATDMDRVALLGWVALCGFGGGLAMAVLKPASRIILITAAAPYALYLAVLGDRDIRLAAFIVLSAIPIALRQFGRSADFLENVTLSETRADALRRRSDETLLAFMETPKAASPTFRLPMSHSPDGQPKPCSAQCPPSPLII